MFRCRPLFSRVYAVLLFIFVMCISSNLVYGQFVPAAPVTQIFTDYRGWWSSSSTALNPIRPDNTHHVLGFRWNNQVYATGVDNNKLLANGVTFTPTNFQAFSVQDVSFTTGQSRFFGFGQMFDGIHNGMTPPAPFIVPGRLNDILKRGIRGLDIGSGVTNIPANEPLTFIFGSIFDISKIGDNVPDILISQIAQPTNTTDEVYFEDINGNLVGNRVSISFNLATQAPKLGSWLIDFWNPNGTVGLVNTERDIRLWARDASAFGLNESNFHLVYKMRYKLGGDSDPAFLAYNADLIKVLAAYPDYIQANANQPVQISHLANDVFSSGATISTIVLTGPSNGQVVLNPNGTFTYTPNTNFVGTDQFNYRICDQLGNCDETIVTITVGSADLRVTKTVSNSTPAIGSNVTFAVTVRNLGPQVATNIVLNDLLPSGFTYVSYSTAPTGLTYLTETGNVAINSLNVNADVILNIVARVNATGTYTNTATVTGEKYDPIQTNNTASVLVRPIAQASVTGGGIVCASEPMPAVNIQFSGQGPWQFTYRRDNTDFTVNNFIGTTYSVPNVMAGTYRLVSFTDGNAATQNSTGQVSVEAVTTPTYRTIPPNCGAATGGVEVLSPLGANYEYRLYSVAANSYTAWQSSVSFMGLATTPAQYRIEVRHVLRPVCTAVTGNFSISALNTARITISHPELCAGQIGYTATSVDQGNTYLWTITNGVITAGATARNVTFQPTGNASSVTLSLVLTSGGCTSSASVTIPVAPTSVGGTLAITTGNGPYCAGQQATLQLSGHTGGIVRWQSKTPAAATWTDIAHQQLTYQTPALSTTMQYRAVVKSGVCSEATSGIATVNVVADFTASITGSDAVYCVGTTATALLVDGGTAQVGYTYQWYRNLYPQTLGATAIPNATGASFTPPTNVESEYYYYVVKTQACLSKTSSMVNIATRSMAAANAGPSQSASRRMFTMAANLPIQIDGSWSVVSIIKNGQTLANSNVVITTPNSPNTTITIPTNSVATLRWTLTNGVCTSTSDVVITSRQAVVVSNPILLNRGR